ncbi:hypothetical protein FB446DRAFT_795951 [Lentinula raphanica]|nr:hypothetical protein FB446DRAFT_795951 [Lentinula raphanica]
MTTILPAHPWTPATSLLTNIWNLNLPETSSSCLAIIHLDSTDKDHLLNFYKKMWYSQSPQAAWNWLMERLVQDATLRCSWAVEKEEISVERCFSKIEAVKKLCDELSPFRHAPTPPATAKPLQKTSIPSPTSFINPSSSSIPLQSSLSTARSSHLPSSCSTAPPPPGLPKHSELNQQSVSDPPKPPQHALHASPSFLSNCSLYIPPSLRTDRTRDLGFSVASDSDSSLNFASDRPPTCPNRLMERSSTKSPRSTKFSPPYLSNGSANCHGIKSGVLRQVKRHIHGPFGTLSLKSHRHHIERPNSSSPNLDIPFISPGDPHHHKCSPHLCGHSWRWRVTSSDSGLPQNLGHLHANGLSNTILLELAGVIRTVLLGG